MFSQNKKKTDSRVRWQNPRFKSRLVAQRSYKRPTRHLPETAAAVFLSKIGLGTWWARGLTALGFFILVYLVFIPNFLFIKHINIAGAADLASVQNSVNAYLEKKLPWPQQNLVLLSKAGLADYLLKNNPKVLKVNKITKKLPNTLAVDITARTDEFLLKTQTSAYSISNDGQVTNQLISDASATLPSGLVLIKLDSEPSLTLGQQALALGSIKAIQTLLSQLPEAAKAYVDFFGIEDLQAQDISAYLKTGLKIIFSSDSNLQTALTRLGVLISQFSDQDKAKLFYIDMRSVDKAYVCQKGAPCVKDINLPSQAATSTQNNISN